MEEQVVIVSLNKIINKFILRSKAFVEYTAFPYGYVDLLQHGVKSSKLTSDHEYFAFVKSTKTLLSIRELLKLQNNEDVLILVRSIYENYLSCRYLNENEDKIDDFLTNPLNLFYANFIIDKEGRIFNRYKKIVGKQLNPTSFKTGKDKSYYYNFYGFLSTFSHSNFGISSCFLDENLSFTIYKENYPVLARIFTVFVFTKIFEHVVTVKGEDFINRKTEKLCYELVEESLLLQDVIFSQLIDEYKGQSESLKHQNKRFREMFKGMKKSLREELGSVKIF